MDSLSSISKSTVAMGVSGALLIGYCIYFDHKRRSAKDFKKKLHEKRQERENRKNKRGKGSKLPDLTDHEAVQRYFLQEIQMGEALIAQGDVVTGVEHLANAVIVCGQPTQLIQVLQQTLPSEVFALLIHKIKDSQTELIQSAPGQRLAESSNDDLELKKMVQRLTLRRRLSYNTKSNKRRIVRTPGGRLVYLYLKKPRSVPGCGQCKEKLRGVTPSRPSERPRMSRRLKTVSRTFGGVLCHICLRERIIRAFLIDEQKVVKVLKAAQASTVKAPRPAKVQPKPAAKPAAAAPQKGGKGDKKATDKKVGDKKTADKKPAAKMSTVKKAKK
ncbi:CLUMA_CG011559, isoform A [Clunio marinus]|uniref:Large ribosomal subunit protein eL34 n=1 Tax=Clunio marinus TaxID=568069 RepID=A0A1J1IF69_9DIPT|nr:CLUMA_CG011559, isoform A [Clunio marinus]